MSDATVSHREFERRRLIAQDNMAAEKLRRKEEAEIQKREQQKLVFILNCHNSSCYNCEKYFLF